nr:hypothetical protein [Endozoicomonas sp.]
MSSTPMPDIMADEALIERYNSGDAAAFDILYERYRQSFYNYLVKTTGNAALADDIYQNCWEKIIQKRGTCSSLVLVGAARVTWPVQLVTWLV